MKRLLLGLSLVVSLAGCHTLIQVGKFPEAPQVYGGIRTMENPRYPRNDYALHPLGLLIQPRILHPLYNAIDFFPSLAMDTALLPLTIWVPLSRWSPGSSESAETVPQEAPTSSIEESLPE